MVKKKFRADEEGGMIVLIAVILIVGLASIVAMQTSVNNLTENAIRTQREDFYGEVATIHEGVNDVLEGTHQNRPIPLYNGDYVADYIKEVQVSLSILTLIEKSNGNTINIQQVFCKPNTSFPNQDIDIVVEWSVANYNTYIEDTTTYTILKTPETLDMSCPIGVVRDIPNWNPCITDIDNPPSTIKLHVTPHITETSYIVREEVPLGPGMSISNAWPDNTQEGVVSVSYPAANIIEWEFNDETPRTLSYEISIAGTDPLNSFDYKDRENPSNQLTWTGTSYKESNDASPATQYPTEGDIRYRCLNGPN